MVEAVVNSSGGIYMSDDLNKKIQQIAELLGQDNMPENVKELLSLLAGSLGSKEETQSKVTDTKQTREEKTVLTEAGDNTEMLSRVKKVMDKLSIGNDSRMNLLQAIKPFMNNNRQKKLGDCIQLLQMVSLSRLMNDHDK